MVHMKKEAILFVAICCVCIGCQTTKTVSDGRLVSLSEDRIVGVASKAVKEKYPAIRLSDYALGQIVCIHYPALTPAYIDMGRGSEFSSQDSLFLGGTGMPRQQRIFVDWLGIDSIEVEKGPTPDKDRKKVKKIRVEMTSTGRIEGVSEGATWLQRSMVGKGYPKGVKEVDRQ